MVTNNEHSEILPSNGMFKIEPSDRGEDIRQSANFKELKLNPSQKIQVSGLFQQLPSLMAAETVSKAYILKFPEGISGACNPMQYVDGGIGTPIVSVDGKIVNHASLHNLSGQAVVLGAFNAMSIASGQYFLSQINNELKAINQSIDKILEFLYGDKKAELISEVSFVKAAYQNYSSIMSHEQQRLATIVSLQESRKVAMKDIEFYMSDLDSAINGMNKSEVSLLVKKAIEIKECLDLSIQLYAMANLLEVYYAQNYDVGYISYIEEEAVVYMGKCEKRILSSFSRLITHIQTLKEGPLKKIDKSALEKKAAFVVDSLTRGTESEMLKSFRSALHATERNVEYHVLNDGTLYLKTG